MFVSVLRKPDNAFGATEASEYRFEEAATAACDVQYDYVVGEQSAKVIVYPSGSPVKFLKLRFRGDLHCVESVYGDQWERSGGPNAYLEWRSVMPHRALGWFCYAKAGEHMACYGVKTGADCFAFWQLDTHGITLCLNLCGISGGTDLREPLVACEVVEMFREGEDPYAVAKAFSARMCDKPLLPREPIFGVNNWYWAYGHISRESVRTETDYLMQMCDGTKHRPYMILDDGWQFNRSYGQGAYIGGPWLPNERFGSMSETAAEIHEKGAKAGIWFRPLLTLGSVPEEAQLAKGATGGVILDPTHPYTLERVERDARTIRDWGFDLIKHDFTTDDITGVCPLTTELHTVSMRKGERSFFDKTVTLATAIKRLYAAIARGAGDADVIGCNVVGHLAAGIHSTWRVGNDTSGRSFEWTRRHGVNSVMRLPFNDTVCRVDPDCAAFTDQVDAQLNLDYLEMCALTGMTTLASVTPGILKDAEMRRINEIYRMAARDEHRYGIRYFDRNANPEVFVSEDGKNERAFDWTRAYDGTRVQLNWMK